MIQLDLGHEQPRVATRGSVAVRGGGRVGGMLRHALLAASRPNVAAGHQRASRLEGGLRFKTSRRVAREHVETRGRCRGARRRRHRSLIGVQHRHHLPADRNGQRDTVVLDGGKCRRATDRPPRPLAPLPPARRHPRRRHRSPRATMASKPTKRRPRNRPPRTMSTAAREASAPAHIARVSRHSPSDRAAPIAWTAAANRASAPG